MPDELMTAAAAVPFSMGVAIMVVGLARLPLAGRMAPVRLSETLSLGLEFLLAATLLRLAALDTYLALSMVATTIVVRKVITAGIRLSIRALG
jgi:uncharacterized membrane protein